MSRFNDSSEVSRLHNILKSWSHQVNGQSTIGLTSRVFSSFQFYSGPSIIADTIWVSWNKSSSGFSVTDSAASMIKQLFVVRVIGSHLTVIKLFISGVGLLSRKVQCKLKSSAALLQSGSNHSCEHWSSTDPDLAKLVHIVTNLSDTVWSTESGSIFKLSPKIFW